MSVAVLASGMTTGVGLAGPASCAAIRCAITHFVETRFMIKRCEPGACRASWQGYSYQWNDAGDEATLLDNTSELNDEIGSGIAQRGQEFGTVTGRPRRVGWLDAVPLRYAVAVNSVSSIMLNKIDILSGLESICLSVAYEVDGRRVDRWPSSAESLARAKPIYERFAGWEEPLHDVRSLAGIGRSAPAG